MAYVKIDCGLLNSTLWMDRDGRDVFLTALLMAVPHEAPEPLPTIATRSLDDGDFVVPAGWYGFVPAAGIGIIHRAGVGEEAGYSALERLASVDPESRSPAHGGRRLVRVAGGFIVLNYIPHRDRDHTSPLRSKRYRERLASRRDDTASRERHGVSDTHAEAEASATDPDPAIVEFAGPNSTVPASMHSGPDPESHASATQGNGAGRSEPGSIEGAPGPEKARQRAPRGPTEATAEVRDLFAYWQRIHGHPRAVLDGARARKARIALGTHGADVCRAAIRGARLDAFCQGRDPSNRSGRVYDDLALILRDAAHVERFAALGGAEADDEARDAKVRALAERWA